MQQNPEVADQTPSASIAFAGELDVATAPGLLHDAQAALQDQPERLSVDLSQMLFCDSRGAQALVQIEEQCRLDGIALRFARPALPTAMRVFELTGLTDALPFDKP